ncbi:hypothetical protein LBMAG53_22680 [Planctomycetota bacterium]|nr:hypothetical protein LBMAG53_22680 [Planctomycetota bacterium]
MLNIDHAVQTRFTRAVASCRALALCALVVAVATAGDSLEFIIDLPDGLVVQDLPGGKDPKPVDRREDWRLAVTVRDGKAEPTAWGMSPADPELEQWGTVESAQISPDAMSFAVRLTIRPTHGTKRARRRETFGSDVFIGGSALWTVRLKRTSAGQDGGTWSGIWQVQSTTADTPDYRETLERTWATASSAAPGSRYHGLMDRVRCRLATATGEGPATVRVQPAPPKAREPAAFEHPRLFFRKSDLPTIRQRAATPEGKAIIAQVEQMLADELKYGYKYHKPGASHSAYGPWGAGHALMYALTGDKRHADQSRRSTAGAPICVYPYGGGGVHPYNIMATAIAYDLCYDAWPEDFRHYIWAYLYQNLRDFALVNDEHDYLLSRVRYGFGNDSGNWGVRGEWDAGAVKDRAAGAIAALAIQNDPPPAEMPPTFDQIPTIEPASDAVAAPGTPVVPFTDAFMPTHWLINGPFAHGLMDDPVASLGGLGKFQPYDGQEVEHAGARLAFRRYLAKAGDATEGIARDEVVDPSTRDARGPRIYPRDCGRFWLGGTHGGYYPGMDLWRRLSREQGKSPGTDIVMYTVISNEAERVVQAQPNWGWQSQGVRMWINGHEVKDGDLVRLRPGLYPLMCFTPITGGYSNQAPHLTEYTEADRAVDAARVTATKAAFADGGELRYLRELLARAVRRYIRDRIGPEAAGGWQGSLHDTLLPFLAIWKLSLGQDLAAGTGLDQLVPMALRRRQLWDAGMAVDMATQSLAIMPERWRGPARWLIDRDGWGLDQPYQAVALLASLPDPFVAQDPAGKMPLAVVDQGQHLAEFSSGFAGKDGFLVVLNGAGPMGSAAGFGDLAIFGKQRIWVRPRGYGFGYGDWFGTNHLFCPEIMPAAPGRMLHSDLKPDGSGSVSFAMESFYRGYWNTPNSTVKHTESPLGPKNMNWNNTGPMPGVRMVRAIAVDYSGIGGAPCVVAICDRVSGLNADMQKTWRADMMPVSDVYEAFDNKRFAVIPARPNHGGAPNPSNLKITFPVPVGLEMKHSNYPTGGPIVGVIMQLHLDRKPTETEVGTVTRDVASAESASSGRIEQKSKRPGDDLSGDGLDGIAAQLDQQFKTEDLRDRNGDVHFLAIITIQDGKPPAVTTLPGEKRPNAVVGERTFIFDGEKLITP